MKFTTRFLIRFIFFYFYQNNKSCANLFEQHYNFTRPFFYLDFLMLDLFFFVCSKDKVGFSIKQQKNKILQSKKERFFFTTVHNHITKEDRLKKANLFIESIIFYDPVTGKEMCV